MDTLEIQRSNVLISTNVNYMKPLKIFIGMLHWIPSPFYGTYPYSDFGNFESNTNPAPCGLHLYKNDASNYNAAICHDKIPHIDSGVKYHCECREYLEFRTDGLITSD